MVRPLPKFKVPTREEAEIGFLRTLYIHDEITLDEFEQYVWESLNGQLSRANILSGMPDPRLVQHVWR